MGRKAECTCDWNGASGKVKALVEPPELILRGQLRRRIPFPEIQQVRVEGEKLRFDVGPDSVVLHLGNALAVKKVRALIEPPELILRGQLRRRITFPEMQQVRAQGEKLCFDVGPDSVALHLGNALAVKWVQYLTAPAPSLAKKLGITSDTVVRMIGKADDDALVEALAAAQSSADTGPGDLILARVNTPQELFGAFKTAADQLDCGVPIWFIYPKGKGHPQRWSRLFGQFLFFL